MSIFMTMSSGRKFYFGTREPGCVTIEEIGHHLSNLQRYTGAARFDRPCSILLHSLLVENLVCAMGGSYEERLQALLHDGHEMVMNDLSTPFEHWILSKFDIDLLPVKKDIDRSIEAGLGLPQGFLEYSPGSLVNIADKAAFGIEYPIVIQNADEGVNEYIQRVLAPLNKQVVDKADSLFRVAVGIPAEVVYRTYVITYVLLRAAYDEQKVAA